MRVGQRRGVRGLLPLCLPPLPPLLVLLLLRPRLHSPLLAVQLHEGAVSGRGAVLAQAEAPAAAGPGVPIWRRCRVVLAAAAATVQPAAALRQPLR